MLGILNIKIPDMLSHKRCHGDSGILGCAEYELKMSNTIRKFPGGVWLEFLFVQAVHPRLLKRWSLVWRSK